MDDADVRTVLKTAHEYSYLHEEWVNPLAEALEGITLEKALVKPGPDTNCIWSIVLHMAVWNENMVERVLTGEKSRPVEGAWPQLPALPDEKEWEKAKQRLWDSISALGKMIDEEPLDKIEASPYGIPDLICRPIHMAYHIGQITAIKDTLIG